MVPVFKDFGLWSKAKNYCHDFLISSMVSGLLNVVVFSMNHL